MEKMGRKRIRVVGLFHNRIRQVAFWILDADLLSFLYSTHPAPSGNGRTRARHCYLLSYPAKITLTDTHAISN